MIYNNVVSGRFVSRPNRFIAIVDVDGAEQMCHVKNTGRCRELLVPGASVFLEVSSNPNRKTKYDLISVYKGDNLINIDSQASNKVFNEWLNENKLFNINIDCKDKKVDIFKCMNNINNILNKEKIILTIDDKENFIASLLDNVLIEKEILEKED